MIADALGTVHPQTRGRPVRIVSLVPSVTELVCALGLAESLVGRTGFCIHPRAALARIPKVGGTKDVKIDAIRALAPTHVIVNVEENRREDYETLTAFVPHVVVTWPRAPEDNPALYRLLGRIFDRERAAEALAARFDAAFAAAREATAALATERVLYLVWREPWMTVGAGTYIGRTLAAVGWTVAGRADEADYPAIDLAPAAERVDRVLASSEPYRFGRQHLDEIRALTGKPVALIDGEMTSWYGPRAIEGMAYLARYRREGTVESP